MSFKVKELEVIVIRHSTEGEEGGDITEEG